MTASTGDKIQLPPIMRPNGKLYRPRAVIAHCWDNTEDGYGDDCGAVVLGTHDINRARPLAEQACDAWHGVRHAIKPEVGWFRRGYESGRRVWLHDEVRGAGGVMFTASDDPEEV